MSLEIERKFLVKDNSFISKSYKNHYIKQGFLNTHKERTVRVRISDTTGYITVKGITNKTGMSRFEWEKEISVSEAESLLALSEQSPIEKTRYLVKNEEFTFEIDVFLDENEGLIIAEIELNSENDTFHKPKWLGEEVTGDVKYYNSTLSKIPFKNW